MVTSDQIAEFRRQGFIHIPGMISPEEAASYYAHGLDAAARLKAFNTGKIINQFVNVWQVDPSFRRLTFDLRIAEIAGELTGVPLRLWHDQLLIKWPEGSLPTHFHQDQPYWPHKGPPEHALSCWIALSDVPVERGCITFIPNTQIRDDLPPQNFEDPDSLFKQAPEMRWKQRITIPMRAGDCTFHHGRTAHGAHANTTDQPRLAFVVIFTEESTRFDARKPRHVLTEPLALQDDQRLPDDLFPPVSTFNDHQK